MKIDGGEVRHVAQLARLELDREELEIFRSQLDAILGYFDRLKELDTSGVPPTSQVIPLGTSLRQDVAGAPISREDSLANAPEAEGGLFKIPRITG